MHKIFTLFLLLFTSVTGFSQFNDTIRYHFNLASTGTINKTNDRSSYVFSNILGFNAKKKGLMLNADASWIYGEQNSNLTNNDFSAHSDVDLRKDVHKLYYWGLTTYDKSYSLKINHRFQAGAGLAYDFIDSSSVKFNISDGILYEQGDLIDANNMREVYQVPRNSFRLLYHWSLKGRLMIEGVHFYQPSLTNISDYIIQSTSTLSVKLKKWLSITGSVVYNKVSRTRRENLLITYGITIEKYF